MSLRNITIIALFIVVHSYSQSPLRIISLTPSITDHIYSMNAQDQLIACTSYCMEAVEDGKMVIGSTLDVNVEKILSLKPDLILTMGLTKQHDIETIKMLGLNIQVLETPKSFDEICKQTLEIGTLIQHQADAEEIVRQAKAKVKLLTQQKSKESSVFFQIGAHPTYAVLENTFMDDYITLCNGNNIAQGLKIGNMTRESILRKDPDIIIIATMGGFGMMEKETWESYSQMKASMQKKVFLIESDICCSPTPENFVIALEEVYHFIND